MHTQPAVHAAPASGLSVVLGFAAGPGGDVIDLTAARLDSFDRVQAMIREEEALGTTAITRIALDGDRALVLWGVSSRDLAPENFKLN